jgi:hypothetical protein
MVRVMNSSEGFTQTLEDCSSSTSNCTIKCGGWSTQSVVTAWVLKCLLMRRCCENSQIPKWRLVLAREIPQDLDEHSWQKTAAHVTHLIYLVEGKAFLLFKTMHMSVKANFLVSHGYVFPQTSSCRKNVIGKRKNIQLAEQFMWKIHRLPQPRWNSRGNIRPTLVLRQIYSLPF